MEEVWKDIYYYDYTKGEWIDYRGLYQVSSEGRIKSLNYRQTGKEKILKLGKTKDGYLRIELHNKEKRKSFRVHRLVAHMFVDGYFDGADVNHIDENKENNCVDNLEWCTRKYNNNYGTHNERIAKTLSIFVFLIKESGEKWFDEPLSLIELNRKTKISLYALWKSLHNKKPLSAINAKYDPKYIGSYVIFVKED